MAKRFTSTEIWEEDWFLEMPSEYKLFWYYMLSHCDHAGLYKVNLGSFNRLNGVSVTSDRVLELFNVEKQRITKIAEKLWYIEDFFVFQYGKKLNVDNQVHKSIYALYKNHGIIEKGIRGLVDLNPTPKDKDKDKDIKKGGTGENIRAIEITDNKAIFPDGSTQKLGKSQLYRMTVDDIKPHQILKGMIS